MPVEIVDDKDDVPLFDDDGVAITGHDERVALLTWYIKNIFPDEYERLKGDADILYVEGIHAEADDVMRISYTTVSDADSA